MNREAFHLERRYSLFPTVRQPFFLLAVIVLVRLIVAVPLTMTLATALIFGAGFGVAMGLLSWWQFRRKTLKFKRP
jgi:hypothetical protein